MPQKSNYSAIKYVVLITLHREKRSHKRAIQKQKKRPKIVMPAEAGIQEKQSLMYACISPVGGHGRLRSSGFKHQAPRRCLVFYRPQPYVACLSFPSCYLRGLKTGPYPSCRQSHWPLPWKCTKKTTINMPPLRGSGNWNGTVTYTHFTATRFCFL